MALQSKMKDVKAVESANYANGGGKMNLRELCAEYSREIIFGAVLLVCVCLSYWLAHYIPMHLYGRLSMIMNGCIATICFAGAWMMVRHTNGMIVRKVWICVQLIYAFFAMLLLMRVTSYVGTTKEGLVSMQGWEMVVGNFLLWLLLLYPMVVLRPGWMTVSRAILQGLPVLIAWGLDQLFAIDLRVLLALYPVLLLGFLIFHIKKYRQWCEENYSSMDNIDTQWIVRYIIMYLIDGALFFVLCFFATVPVAFTQQWVILLIVIYSTEQILFRKDPWAAVVQNKPMKKELPMMPEEEKEEPDTKPEMSHEANAAYRATLEKWMEEEKPYLNPDFRLIDLRQILPLNRTYLSQLINAEYGCSFYQFVTNYRIEEAKRLMRAHPEMKMQDVGEQCGFSSPTVFARIFARETGMSPSAFLRLSPQKG